MTVTSVCAVCQTDFFVSPELISNACSLELLKEASTSDQNTLGSRSKRNANILDQTLTTE